MYIAIYIMDNFILSGVLYCKADEKVEGGRFTFIPIHSEI